jgi:hypothetical protein
MGPEHCLHTSAKGVVMRDVLENVVNVAEVLDVFEVFDDVDEDVDMACDDISRLDRSLASCTSRET